MNAICGPNLVFEETKRKLNNDEWLCKHEYGLKELFPKTYTHLQNIDDIKLKHHLSLYGLDVMNREQFNEVLDKLVERRIILRNGMTVKRNPHDCIYD